MMIFAAMILMLLLFGILCLLFSARFRLDVLQRRADILQHGLDVQRADLRKFVDKMDQQIQRPGNPIERQMVFEAMLDMMNEELSAGEMARTIDITRRMLNPKLSQASGDQDCAFVQEQPILTEAYRRANLHRDLAMEDITPITGLGTDGTVDVKVWPEELLKHGSTRPPAQDEPFNPAKGDDDVR